MTDDSATSVDYDLSEGQVQRALQKYGVKKSEVNEMMLRVMRLVTTREFYERRESNYNLPDYAFQPTDIVEAEGYKENTRESIRKRVLKPLRGRGVLGYEEPVPNSPKTHYFLTQEFREYLDDTQLEDLLDEPDPADERERAVSLPYHDEEISRAPGEHAELLADGLRVLVPRLAASPNLVHEGLDKSEREDIESKELPISFGGVSVRLSVYPDAVVFDEADDVLYLLESVTSRGPFTDRRIQTVLEDLNRSDCDSHRQRDRAKDIEQLRVVFVTMFPDTGRLREHLMGVGGQSYVWLSDHPDELRAFGRHDTTDESVGSELSYRHVIDI